MQERLKKVGFTSNLIATPLLVAGMLLNSAGAVAQNDQIPFNAMMQSAGAQTATPPAPALKDPSSQRAPKSSITNGGKAEITGGIILVGAGILTVVATAAVSSYFKSSGGKEGALYGGGAAATGVGVTLIVIGSHRRSTK